MCLIRDFTKPQLLMLIGLPGSGKSILGQRIANQYPESKIISTDVIRSQLFGDANIQGRWLLIWREIERQLREVLIKNLPIAIYDATNVVRKQRKEVIKLARKIGFNQITGIWLNTPVKLCLNRNQNRDRTVSSEVILEMADHLYDAPPTLEDGFEELIYCFDVFSPLSFAITGDYCR